MTIALDALAALGARTPSPLREALHDVHHTLAGGAVSHEEALRLSERARVALDGAASADAMSKPQPHFEVMSRNSSNLDTAPAPDARQAVVEAARRIEMLARGLYMAGATSTGAWPPWLERSPNLAVGTVHRDPLRFAAELHAIAAALAAAPPRASQGGETVPMHGTEGGEHG